MAPTNVDLEQYRSRDEGLDQWAVKKAFLKKNWDSFPGDRRNRLIALAHCFHNIHVWGCSYPPKVMAEVNALAEGLMTNKPKETKKPNVVKIDSVNAIAVSNMFSVLDVKKNSGTRSDEAMQIDDNRTNQSAERKREKRRTRVAASFKMETNDKIQEEEPIALPRCGFGFKSSPNVSLSEVKSNFVFGKGSDYIKRLGFVRSTQVNEGFQFGKEILPNRKSAPGGGEFQFGVESKSTQQQTQSTKEFSFGKGRKNSVDTPEDLRTRFENASLHENNCKPRSEDSNAKQPELVEHSNTLTRLETVRNRLKNVRPPLAQARVEFIMLQVNLATEGKVQVDRKGGEISLTYEGVLLASGSHEATVYADFLNKIISPEPWYICSRGTQQLLEVGSSIRAQSPVKRYEKNPGGSNNANLPPAASSTEATHVDTKNSDALDGSAASTKPRRNLAGASSSAGAPATNGSPNGRSKLLTDFAHKGILTNLDIVRDVFRTPNFRTRVEMIGGFEKDPSLALNIAFHTAVLKPVRGAEVANTSCRYHFSEADTQRQCVIKVNGIYIADASGNSNQEAKKKAAEHVLKLLRSKRKFTIVYDNGENRLYYTGDKGLDPRSPAQPKATPAAAACKNKGINELFLVVSANDKSDLNAILNRSSHANDLSPPVFSYSQEGKEEICYLKMNGQHSLEFEARGETKAVSRLNAIRLALNTLIAACPTIVVSSISQNANEFVKESMPLGTESRAVRDGLNRRIAQDNVGYQLLEKMGWTGGSLGGGSGLIEPIMISDNSGNRGLGYAKSDGPGKRFKANIYSTLRVFLRETDVFEELKFSPTFSNVERGLIHTIARQLGLKSKSSDRPEGRVLCVSHNIDWKMILDSLKREGGAVGKFRLLQPGEWSLPNPVR